MIIFKYKYLQLGYYTRLEQVLIVQTVTTLDIVLLI